MRSLKKFLLILGSIVGFSSFLSAASLRDYVCIVRVNYSEGNKQFLQKLRNKQSTTSKQFSNYINSFLENPPFGSGFIYVGSNGKKYIITNRHVVEDADTVTIQFEKSDGTYEEYKDLKILGVDEKIDIAVIELPSNFSRVGLTFKTSNVDDGAQVWTAGFPGLGNKPSWQFGNGVVTNSIARIDELVDSNITTIIQHSAQVDSGNSGGPLLVSDSKAKSGYSVVGINTWKAFSRENTNFAIPASIVKKTVDSIISSKGVPSSIDNKIKLFTEAINDTETTFEYFSKYVSNSMVASFRSIEFTNIYQEASSSARDTILSCFVYNPIQGVKYSISYYMYKRFRKYSKIVDFTVESIEDFEKGKKVVFSIGENEKVISYWIIEQGIWKVFNFDDLAKDETKEQEKKDTNDTLDLKDNLYLFSLNGGYVINGNIHSYIASASLNIIPNLNLGVGIRGDNEYKQARFFISSNLIIPIKFNRINISPFVGTMGIFGSSRPQICFDCGLSCDIKITPHFAFQLGGAFNVSLNEDAKSFYFTAGLTFGKSTVTNPCSNSSSSTLW